MPQDTKKYTETMQDGRRKLNPAQHAEIREWYREHGSLQKTADHFEVSKRLVFFIINPKKYRAQLARNKRDKHYQRYYNTDKRREYMRTYRAKKRALGFMVTKNEVN